MLFAARKKDTSNMGYQGNPRNTLGVRRVEHRRDQGHLNGTVFFFACFPPKNTLGVRVGRLLFAVKRVCFLEKAV